MVDAAAKLAARISVTDFETWAADEDLRLVTERFVEIIGKAARDDARRPGSTPGGDAAGDEPR